MSANTIVTLGNLQFAGSKTMSQISNIVSYHGNISETICKDLIIREFVKLIYLLFNLTLYSIIHVKFMLRDFSSALLNLCCVADFILRCCFVLRCCFCSPSRMTDRVTLLYSNTTHCYETHTL